MPTFMPGWKRQSEDSRDHLFAPGPPPAGLPSKVDLRPFDVPIFDQGQIGSCHDDQTEVLTSSGWKPFADAMLTDRLATVNPDNGNLTFEFPLRIVRLPFAGMLYYGKHRGLDFAVTPNHKMLVRPWVQSEKKLNPAFQLIDMENVGWYAGLMDSVHSVGEDSREVFVLPGVPAKHKQQRVDRPIPMEVWLKFLGIYLAEGTMLKQKKGEMYKIQIAAVKEREKAFVREVLADMNQHALELSDRFTINNQQIYTALGLLGLKSVKAPDKFVPEFVFALPSAKIKALLLGHFMGDGSEQRGTRTHHTSSARLADDIQRLLLLSGTFSSLTTRLVRESVMSDGRSVKGQHEEKAVIARNGRGGLSIDRKANVEQRPYAGTVYCAEVPTYHTLVTRRNGKVLVSGNCTANSTIGCFMFEAKKDNISIEVRSRLQLYYNSRVAEGDPAQDGGAQLRDVIKVLNKQGVCPESEWPYDVAKFAVAPPQQTYADGLLERVTSYAAVNQDLASLKSALAAGRPVAFGFDVYPAFESAAVAKTGIVPMPRGKAIGGHAVRLVGYDDATKRFIVANSWGTGWGDKGYLYMPYAYVVSKHASDFWTISACGA